MSIGRSPECDPCEKVTYPNIVAAFPEFFTTPTAQANVQQWPYRATLDNFIGNIETAVVAVHRGIYHHQNQTRVLSIEDLKWMLYSKLDVAAKTAFEDTVRGMFLKQDSERYAMQALDRVFNNKNSSKQYTQVNYPHEMSPEEKMVEKVQEEGNDHDTSDPNAPNNPENNGQIQAPQSHNSSMETANNTSTTGVHTVPSQSESVGCADVKQLPTSTSLPSIAGPQPQPPISITSRSSIVVPPAQPSISTTSFGPELDSDCPQFIELPSICNQNCQ